jgi:hypothetical protein
VDDWPSSEYPVIDRTLPVFDLELTVYLTTFGKPNAVAIISCVTNLDQRANL